MAEKYAAPKDSVRGGGSRYLAMLVWAISGMVLAVSAFVAIEAVNRKKIEQPTTSKVVAEKLGQGFPSDSSTLLEAQSETIPSTAPQRDTHHQENNSGGWQYHPRPSGETTVCSPVYDGLSKRMFKSGPIDSKTHQEAKRFLDGVQSDSSS